MNEQIKRKKPEPDHPAPSERHARRRADEILRAPGSLPRDLDDWLHTERELLAEQKGPAGPGEQAGAVGDGGNNPRFQ